MATPLSVLYVAASLSDATDGATALEAAEASVTAEAAATIETAHEQAPSADCVVFAETPTTAAGAQLLEVVAACRRTPLILYVESDYGPTTACETDGVDGYVRREEQSITHLVDEIRWVCQRGQSEQPIPTDDGMRAENASDGVFTLTTDGQITDANESLERLLGVEASALRGTPLTALSAAGTLSGDDVEAIIDAVEQVVTGATDETALTTTIDAGEPIEVWLTITGDEEVAVVRVRPVDGEITGAEADVDDEQPVTLFDELPNPAIRHAIVDGAIVVRDVNAAFERQFSYDRTTADETGDYLVPADIENTLAEANRSETSQTTVRRETATGVRDFRVRHVRLADDETVSIYRDITEQTRDRRTLLARNERLDTFATLVEHDLRDALNVASGSLELVRETGHIDYLSEVKTAHGQLEAHFDQLQHLASYVELLAETEPVAVHDIARRAWTAVETADATLQLADNGLIEADKARVTELLEVLIRTAVMDSHRTELTIQIGATDTGFFIADNNGDQHTEWLEMDAPATQTITDGTTTHEPTLVEQITAAHDWTLVVTECVDGGTRLDVDGASLDDGEPSSERDEIRERI